MIAVNVAIVLLPWSIRRLVLQIIYGYAIHKKAYISRFALVLPSKLELGPYSSIRAFTVCKGLELLVLKECASIGPFNWITAFPLRTKSKHFELDIERKPQLIVERHAAITSRHIIDCTNEVVIGAFSTIAGFRSQILTHSIVISESRQRSKPIYVGKYCFVGTCCVLLGGSTLPNYSVLGAQSLLASRYEAVGYLYGGVPAKPIKPVDRNAKYFSRQIGYVQ